MKKRPLYYAFGICFWYAAKIERSENKVSIKCKKKEENILIYFVIFYSSYEKVIFKINDQKIKKSNSNAVITLKPTIDILAEMGNLKKEGQFLVGFALETKDALNYAKDKLQRKNLDLIIMNTLADEGAGFNHSKLALNKPACLSAFRQPNNLCKTLGSSCAAAKTMRVFPFESRYFVMASPASVCRKPTQKGPAPESDAIRLAEI